MSEGKVEEISIRGNVHSEERGKSRALTVSEQSCGMLAETDADAVDHFVESMRTVACTHYTHITTCIKNVLTQERGVPFMSLNSPYIRSRKVNAPQCAK